MCNFFHPFVYPFERFSVYAASQAHEYRFGRENHGDELSAEGARWREAGASVVQDLSDVLGHVARSDFSLGCGNGA